MIVQLRALVKDARKDSYRIYDEITEDDIEQVIATVRCDNCKIWRRNAAENDGFWCKDWCEGLLRSTPPDFFCQKFLERDGQPISALEIRAHFDVNALPKLVALKVGEVSAELDNSTELPSAVS